MPEPEPSVLRPPPATVRRIVYLGTPDVAVPPLRALHAAGFDIALVVTRADKRRGRGSALVPSPVKAAALELGLPVTTDVDAVLDADADLGVVVAFGRLIKPHVLEQLAMVNLHFSLLPRWRGAAPVERAILAGDTETGVCVMQVAVGLDTGDVYRRVTVPIAADATLESLRGELVDVGTVALLDALEHGLGPGEPQQGEPVHAAKIERDEYRLDFARPAVELHRTIRVGGAWCEFRGRRLKIVTAALLDPDAEPPSAGVVVASHPDGVVVGTGHGALVLVDVQPEGKPVMAARDWANGARPLPTEHLS